MTIIKCVITGTVTFLFIGSMFVEHFTVRYSADYTPRYSPRATTNFLCNGIWGLISAEMSEQIPLNQVRIDAQSLLRDILTSGMLVAEGKSKPNRPSPAL